jgi:hypothetical protein
VRDPARLAGEAGRRLVVDLNLEGAIPAAQAWKQAHGGEVVGFVSHTDARTIEQARAAGVDRVLARSRFVELLPELLTGESRPGDEAQARAPAPTRGAAAEGTGGPDGIG